MLTIDAEAKTKVYNVAIGENYSIIYLYNSTKEYCAMGRYQYSRINTNCESGSGDTNVIDIEAN